MAQWAYCGGTLRACDAWNPETGKPALPQNPFLVLSRELIGPHEAWVFSSFYFVLNLKTVRPETTKKIDKRTKIA